MPRYRLDIEYAGGPFKGFQAQEGGLLTVQGAIEAAMRQGPPHPSPAAWGGPPSCHQGKRGDHV